jgi:hypothetical protein
MKGWKTLRDYRRREGIGHHRCRDRPLDNIAITG